MADIIIPVLALVGMIIVIPASVAFLDLVITIGRYCDMCPEDDY